MPKQRTKFQKERPPDEAAVDTDWRLFLALPLPDDVQALVSELTARLTAPNLPVRWTAAGSAHLTLHFLGATRPERAELLKMGLSKSITSVPAFQLRTAGLGVFPDFRQPRVLWLGLEGQTGALERLHRETGRALSQLGFEVESGKMHPHITLGRVRDDPKRGLGEQIEAAYRAPEIRALTSAAALNIEVERVELVRSFLDKSGARHVPVTGYALAPKKLSD